jgi:putative tricarboxylic transport membrane protein
VLGPILETALRQSLALSGGSLAIFVTRPISAASMLLVLVLLSVQIFSHRRSPRKETT